MVHEDTLGDFVARGRKGLGLTQEDFARHSGVSLQFLRDLEQGRRTSFQTDKVNLVLKLLGYQLGPVPIEAQSKQVA
jgi:transcriptional regulator with XRE-family HTH domain